MKQAPVQSGPGTKCMPKGSTKGSSVKIGAKTIGTSPNSSKRGKQGE